MTAPGRRPRGGPAPVARRPFPARRPDPLTDPLPGHGPLSGPAPIGDRLRRAPAGPRACRDPLRDPLRLTEPAVIGDRLRIPALWCQVSPCIARFTDPAAAGEADLLARALRGGWRVDALSRLSCPSCQQREPFWATRPLAPGNGSRPAR